MKSAKIVSVFLGCSLLGSLGVNAQVPAPVAPDGGAAAPSPGPAVANPDGGAVTLASDAGAPAPLATVETPKKPVAPPPSPTQVAALEAMQLESLAFERSAKEYRDAVTNIIRVHYDLKKKEVLSTLDERIVYEKAELRKARDTAILKLEQFIGKYSGPTAHPQATPDAMYRLAALYEERARGEDGSDDLTVALRPAIALYRRIINEFPAYREKAGVFYFLGHAYNDAGRAEESQQVWRGLVCANRYPFPVTEKSCSKPLVKVSKDADADLICPLPQDNTEEYWTAWRHRFTDPKMLKKGGPDTRYEDPYKDCQALAQPALLVGEEPKYVAEIWWQIGNWEFDNLDSRGGVVRDESAAVWDFNRAASAYQNSMASKKAPLYGVALYKYSWTLFKQQRYEAATREFVRLLEYTDEQQKLTGDPGADFRGEAYTYIAGSLTNLDFKGPEADEPYIPRPDIIDSEPRPEVAEQKLKIAVERVQDDSLIPQKKTWTIEIYKALAQEFRSLNQFNNAIDVYRAILKKWPLDPSAPEVQAAIAETYDQMNVTKRVGTPEHDEYAGKALEARTALAQYVGTTPWVDANKENPLAIQNAERLVKGGLRLAAAQHTNNGKQSLVLASETGDAKLKIEQLQRALSEYKLAALGWSGFIKQDENAPDVYESKYWLADARHKQIRIGVLLFKTNKERYAPPTDKEIADARAAAMDVRDSTEDDKYLDNAAFFVVDESDVGRDVAFQLFEDSKGAQGIERRTEVKFEGEGENRKVKKDAVPPQVLESIKGRDEYVTRVPASLDSQKRSVEYRFYGADMYFLYGMFEEAKPRFEALYKENCGKNPFGYLAWEKLISMSNMSGDKETSLRLAEEGKKQSCAISETDKAKQAGIIDPTIQEANYLSAREKFKAAMAAPEGAEKKALFREAAGMYEAALSAAPGRDEAPEAAMNSAYAFKAVGDFNKAIELYNKFISEYGSEDRLTALQKGDPKKNVAPNLKKYETRLGYLDQAYDALGTTYFGFFNYQKAAETYDRVASNARFSEPTRKESAKKALIIYSMMGQRDKMRTQYAIYSSLKPTPEEKAQTEFLVANFDYGQWNATGADSGSNRQSRMAAQAALMQFHNANRANGAAGKYVLTSAYEIAKMMKAAGDTNYRAWYQTVIKDWDSYRLRAPNNKDGVNEALVPPYGDYAAEAEFTLLDEEIKGKYDGDSHKYQGSVEDVIGKIDPATKKVTSPGKYQTNAKAADDYDKKLNHIITTYRSPEWVPAALARQGSLFDTLRTGLYNAVPPNVKLFSKKQEDLLKKLEASGRDDLAEKADQVRDAVKDGWRSLKDRELSDADAVMVDRYSKAVTLARAYNVRNAQVGHAIGRLAYFTDIIGDAKMKDYVSKVTDPTSPSGKLSYRDGQFVQTRPGLTAVPPSSGSNVPVPIAP